MLALHEDRPVAISTLASPELADQIAADQPKGVSIVGKTETENIGIEKIIINALAVPTIKFLILCGKESEGHQSGNTLLSLAAHGVDAKMRVIGSKGRKPVLSNITIEEIDAFRSRIEVVDMIGCQETHEILKKVQELQEKDLTRRKLAGNRSAGAAEAAGAAGVAVNIPAAGSAIELIQAKEKDPEQVTLDRSGYFVIVPKAESKVILVEHYSNRNQLLRVIKGQDARSIYWTVIENGWLSEMSHAAYLGKELTRAELSMKFGFKYVQDKA